MSTPKSTDESAPSDHQDRLDAVIAEYLEAVEAGHEPDRDRLIDAHPELADELREFFADQQRMKDFAKHIPPPAAVDQQAIVPQRLRYFGDYELLEEIGRGGQGVVYRAWQHSLGRHVAVKLIRNGEFASEEERQRFVTGARAAAKLDHANIVKIHEIGRQEGFHFFSMDYVQGSNLYQVLCERPLEAKTAAHYVETAARAVHYAHEQGTLHRDLKPSNLLIDSAGRVRITDFELARLVDTDPTVAVPPPRITRTGQALGTPGFMPPEQALGKRGLIGPAGDVYSLGATLYALLTGRPPFQADTPAATLQLVLNAEPVAPRLLNPNFPRELEAICLHCLEKEPHRRYPTAEALADDLERFIDNKPISVRPIGRTGRLWRWSKRNPTVAALAATAALLLVSVTAVATVSYVRESQLRRAADEALARERYLRSQLSASNEQLEQRQARIEALLEELDQAGPSVPTLAISLEDPDPAVRRLACAALGFVGARAGGQVPALIGLLGDADPTVRESASHALARIAPTDDEAMRPLVEALASPEFHIRQQVLGVFTEADGAAVRFLLDALRNQNPRVRFYAIVALMKVRPRREVVGPHLVKAFEDPKRSVRIVARRALRHLWPEKARELLGAPIDAAQQAADRLAALNVTPGDWPQWGGSPLRNNTPRALHLPDRWSTQTGRNVKWTVELGSQSYSAPVIANGRILIGTNNEGRRDPEVDGDKGVVMCFRESDGKFLWQAVHDKLPSGRVNDWPLQGVASTPCIDGDRAYYVSNRCALVCVDLEGFYDGENDGPFTEEVRTKPINADFVWKLDMMGEMGVFPHNLAFSSPIVVGDLLFVNTGNGVDEGHRRIPSPRAPSFIAVNKNTGKLVWLDRSPRRRILHGQWSSPAYGVLDGQPQVIFAGGDGWLYSFDPEGDGQWNSKLLWKFDCNPKESIWELQGRGSRNSILAFPVIYDELVYIAVGQDPEHGYAPGHLWCIDPTKRGDVSPELVYEKSDLTTPVDQQRLDPFQPFDPERHVVRPNPNSALVWHFGSQDKRQRFNNIIFGRTLSSPAIKDDLLVIADLAGFVHCLDAKTGQSYWKYDTLSQIWASPLIADGKIYIADDDGEVSVFRLSADPKVAMNEVDFKFRPIAENLMEGSIKSAAVVANDVLYIHTSSRLYAIAQPRSNVARSPLSSLEPTGREPGS